MKKIVFINIILLALGLASCDRLATEVEPPKVDAQLVLFSFLSPEDKNIKVEVSRSKPVFANTNNTKPIDLITDATVTITNENGLSIQLPYVDSANSYLISATQFAILPGKKYTVTASHGDKKVSGVCTIPLDTVSFVELSTRKLADPSTSSFGPYYLHTFKWNDPVGQQNFYRVSLEDFFVSIFIDDTTTYVQNVFDGMYDDKSKDGKAITGVYSNYSFYGFFNDTTQKVLDCYLLSTDIHYFEYHKRRLNYFGDDPFSEPVQQYSNVTGGIGVVSAFRRTKGKLVVR